jgi:nicotinate phosphoribosyltransferase
MISTHLDLYQLTSLIPHWDQGLGQTTVWMSFFSRRLPRDHEGRVARQFLMWSGLQRSLNFLDEVRFDEQRLQTLCAHPTLGPPLSARPDLLKRLSEWRFEGDVWAPREGELLWANPAVDLSGAPVEVDDVRPAAQTPYLQVKCDLLTAKLIETPLLSIINHMTMVATKAAHIVLAAEGRPIFEFGSRRTHIEAAVDAAYSAYLAGAMGTSNVEAHHRFSVPAVGTMDHFAVQAWERDEMSVAESERAFFERFYHVYPQHASLLVDTYDTFGAQTGIRNAVKATQGNLSGIRIDSQISPENIRRARHLLDELGAPQAKIIVSGGMDEDSIQALKEAPVDAFGIGERLVTSADAPVGVGAVGKLSFINGRPTMKQARGSGKATLPGPLQSLRGPRGDRLTLMEGATSASDERPLIHQVWRGRERIDRTSLEQARAYARLALIEHSSGQNTSGAPLVPISQRAVYLDDGLIKVIRKLVTQ